MLRDAKVIAILPATDMERVLAWYSEKLGLEPFGEVAPGTMGFECADGSQFIIYQREQGTKAEHTVAGWLVEDVEETVEQLREQGVDFEQYDMPGLKTDRHGIAELGGVKTAWFEDSEGNILSITQQPA
jgi:predicted enzyme related to lactoylglutathione lyase